MKLLAIRLGYQKALHSHLTKLANDSQAAGYEYSQRKSRRYLRLYFLSKFLEMPYWRFYPELELSSGQCYVHFAQGFLFNLADAFGGNVELGCQFMQRCRISFA